MNKKFFTLAGTVAAATVALLLSIDSVPNTLNMKMTEEPELEKAFISFIAKYGKQYASKVELSKKYENFKRNYMMV
jgi:hypothetical protein